MTYFPNIRSFTRLSAILVPTALFFAFLLFAKGMVLWSLIPAGLGLCLALAFPVFIGSAEANNHDQNPLIRWVRRGCKYTIIFWLINQPGFKTFSERMSHGAALWDWRLILPLTILVFLLIVAGLRRVNATTDREIYLYYRDETPDSQQSKN